MKNLFLILKESYTTVLEDLDRMMMVKYVKNEKRLLQKESVRYKALCLAFKEIYYEKECREGFPKWKNNLLFQ